jgi:hypothetical protein
MYFSFKTVGQLQVIHQPLSRPKQIRAGEYAVGREIGLGRVNLDVNNRIQHCNNCSIYVNNLGSQNVLEVTEPVLIVRPDDGPIGPKHVALNVLLMVVIDVLD